MITVFDYDWYFFHGKFQNSKLFCHFLLHRRLSQVIYVLFRTRNLGISKKNDVNQSLESLINDNY
jgi:hypothetical protein